MPVFPAEAQKPSAQQESAPQPPRVRLEASAKRNENVPIYQIDNNAVKEMNVRLGGTATIVSEAPVENRYFATELGRPASEVQLLRPASRVSGWHGEVFESHQNSVFNARSFFQVGPVKPSRRNHYGGRFTGALPGVGYLTGDVSQRKARGMVNGNVLVPLASERTPRATDPAVRAVISRWLASYPESLPNRPDFDPRALNTNAPQNIDEIEGTLRLDRDQGGGRLMLLHSLSRHRTRAFQFVAGQNPDTDLHSHRSQLTYQRTLSNATAISAGFAFRRVKSVLLPEPNSVGVRVRVGFQVEELGPDSQFPIDRAENSFRWSSLLTHTTPGGRHQVTAGGELTRYQLNGIEGNNHRGYFSFMNNFGRLAVENLLMGTPSSYEVAIGALHRGFRTWSAGLWVADRWTVTPRFQLYYGVRYGLESQPAEVNGLDRLPYGSDNNNFSPRVSMAWQAGRGWVVRTAYSVSFSQIQPVTYQQVRNNLPGVHYIQVQNPDLLNPLKGISLLPGGRSSPTLFSPDMVSPYSHQYSFSLEQRLTGAYLLRLGYIGSRSFKLLNSFIMNRAEPVPGIPLTLETVNLRRPDPRYFEVRQIVNGGIAYFDAAQIGVEMPLRRGVRAAATYTFGKAIDEGADFASTAANRDLLTARSQWQFESFRDKRGLSNFDSKHALLMSYSYDLPQVGASGWLAQLMNGWQISGITLLKSGTPLTLYMGSDAPGFGNVDGGPSDRPHILDPSILGMTVGHPSTAPLILRRDRFAYLQPGEVRGSLGRGTFRKSSIANFNAAVSRQFRWGSRREWRAVLRGEAYNLGNTPQFDEPQRNLTSPAFGRITNTLNDGRVLQLSLRLIL